MRNLQKTEHSTPLIQKNEHMSVAYSGNCPGGRMTQEYGSRRPARAGGQNCSRSPRSRCRSTPARYPPDSQWLGGWVTGRVRFLRGAQPSRHEGRRSEATAPASCARRLQDRTQGRDRSGTCLKRSLPRGQPSKIRVPKKSGYSGIFNQATRQNPLHFRNKAAQNSVNVVSKPTLASQIWQGNRLKVTD